MIILIAACARFSPVCFFPNLIDGGASTSLLRHRPEVPPFIHALIGAHVSDRVCLLAVCDVCHFNRIVCSATLVSRRFCP